MRVIALKTLREFWARHADAEAPLRLWHSITEHANWSGPDDIRAVFGSADFVGNNRVIFNIGGHKYRLIVHVVYSAKIVYVRFIGTHTQYNRVNAEEV